MKWTKRLMYVIAGGVGVLALQMAFHLANPSAYAEEHPTEHPTASTHGQSHIVVAPFAEDKAEEWQAFVREWAGDAEGVIGFNKRHGLTRQAGWLAHTPAGPVAVILHEGPGSATLMQTMVESKDEYDVAMVARLSELHGMDFSAPPPGPAPELQFDTSQAGSWAAGGEEHAEEHPTEHPE